jgi:pantoate--beta-alanine ligase
MMQRLSQKLHQDGKSIGFIPTMGYLHKGHLSLVTKSKKITDIAVVSIFVNPTQFAPNEDFKKYPRNTKRDAELLEEIGVDYLFLPDAIEIYPSGYKTFVNVDDLAQILEGKYRPTHFRGVTTIVSILFNIVMPDKAFFGQKDAQQVFIIKKMVDDLQFNLRVIVGRIVRENDGLALSSRNIYLSENERKDSLVLSHSLSLAKKMIIDGEKKVSKIISGMKRIINEADSSGLDYISAVNALTFSPVQKLIKGEKYFILVACRIGKTRLIDNILIKA